MYNLKIGAQRVTNLRLSGATIAGIFTNKITMWNDPAIDADNPGLTLPAIRIIPVVRSDGSGATADFTQWMLATEPSDWQAYCQVVGRSPCTQTSAYPVQPGTAMVGQSGDLGVAGYVSQAAANGAIGYVEYSYALETGFPVALVLNAAGYYTEPTPENVAVSLLQAQINTDTSSPLYLTENLSGVYTDTDPRTYELSSYSYMILPTDTNSASPATRATPSARSAATCCARASSRWTSWATPRCRSTWSRRASRSCRRSRGTRCPRRAASFIQGCNNPTFSTNGTNTLADDDPQPPACDKQGPRSAPTAVTVIALGPRRPTRPTAGPGGHPDRHRDGSRHRDAWWRCSSGLALPLSVLRSPSICSRGWPAWSRRSRLSGDGDGVPGFSLPADPGAVEGTALGMFSLTASEDPVRQHCPASG